MSNSTPDAKRPLRDLEDGSRLDQLLLVRDVRRCTTRKGSEYLGLVVADRTAHVPGVMWEPPGMVDRGPVLRVVGRVSDDPRYGRQIVVSELLASEPDEDDLQGLLLVPEEGQPVLVSQLDSLIEGVKDYSLRQLLDRLLGPDGELRDRFVTAAAAKYNHHAYSGGLLEHSLDVASAVAGLAADHRHIDRELAIVGALLHDIGKLDAYDHDLIACDLTDSGRLEGEIAMGYYRIRRAIEDMPEFPENRARALLHIVLSHHGSLEHGSPVVPCTREAALVHAIDELGSRLGAFDRRSRDARRRSVVPIRSRYWGECLDGCASRPRRVAAAMRVTGRLPRPERPAALDGPDRTDETRRGLV